MYFGSVLARMFIAVIKTMIKSNLGRKGFILSQLLSVVAVKLIKWFLLTRIRVGTVGPHDIY